VSLSIYQNLWLWQWKSRLSRFTSTLNTFSFRPAFPNASPPAYLRASRQGFSFFSHTSHPLLASLLRPPVHPSELARAPQSTFIAIGDSIDDLAEGCIIECLDRTTGIGSTNGAVRAALLVKFDITLHGQTAVKDYNERGMTKDISSKREQRTRQRVASKGGVRLDGTHILECSTGHNDRGKLRKLGSEKKAFRMNEGVRKGADFDISEQ
jgi:hypothetical protein